MAPVLPADLDGEYGRDGRAELGIWSKDTGDAFAVEVLRWDGTKLVPAADTYPAYFPQVVDYYAERVQKAPEAGVYWYYLGDARLKAGDSQGAMEAAAKDLALESPYPEPARILLLQGRALTALGRYQEAVEVLTAAMDGKNFSTKDDQQKQMELPFPTRLVAEAHYYRGEAYLGLGDEAHAREDWTQAAQMLPDWEQPRQALERLVGVREAITSYLESEEFQKSDGLEVVASLHAPQPGENVTQALTYPYALAFAPGVEQQPVDFTVREAGSASPTGNNASGAPIGTAQAASGIYMGQIDANSIEIEVSGLPQGQAARAFRLPDQVKGSFAGLGLETGALVRFSYTINEDGQAVITAIERTW